MRIIRYILWACLLCVSFSCKKETLQTSNTSAEQLTFRILSQGHVIGTERLIIKKDDLCTTYHIYRELPFNRFPEETHCVLRLNHRHQVVKYEKENYFQGIRDIAVLEQRGSVNWHYFATNDVQEVTFLPNIVLRQDFCPLDENYAGLFQYLVDRYDFRKSAIQHFSIFDGYGERIIEVAFENQLLHCRLVENEDILVQIDAAHQVQRIEFPAGRQIERVRILPRLKARTNEFYSDLYSTQQVSFRSIDGTRLSGVLTLPASAKDCPAVVLISGTGPNSARHGGIFSAISHQLGEAGIASLRYDKRGILNSSGNFLCHTHHQLIDDAEGALLFLADLPQVKKDKLGLLGHSEGGLIAISIASRSLKVKACFIMASPAVRLYPELAKMQTQYWGRAKGWSKEVVQNVITGIDATIRKMNTDSTNWWRYGRWMGYVGWLRSLLAHNPQKILRMVSKDIPLIFFHGQHDAVVPATQTNLLLTSLKTSGHLNCEAVAFPKLDHLFGRLVKIPECLPYNEYVEVDSVFLEVLTRKIIVTFNRLNLKKKPYWVTID